MMGGCVTQAQHDELRTELAEVRGELDQAKADVKTSKADMDKAHSDLTKAKARGAALEKELAGRKRDLQAAHGERADLKVKLNQLTKSQRSAMLEAKLEARKVAANMGEMKTAMAALMTRMEEELAAAGKMKDEMAAATAKLKDELAAKDTKIKELNARIAELEAELEPAEEQP